jgi:glucokinase
LTRLIGIDVGGTKCLGVRLAADGTVAAEVLLPTPHFEKLAETLVRIVAQLGGADRVGVGVPGLVDRHGVIRSSPNLPGADHLDIGRSLEDLLGQAVVVDNDATCALIAETRFGVARDVRDAWLVTLGTGIGGALVADGMVRRGSQGFAGEVGHMRVHPQGLDCPCGLTGCWERYASGTALARIAGAENAREVVRGARSGNPGSRAAVSEWVEWIAVGLAALVNATDPEMIVLGGGLIEEGDLFVGEVQAALVRHLYGHTKRRVPTVISAALSHRAGAVGAALLARE